MKSNLRVNENRNSFVKSMEHERFNRNWSISEMAEHVGLSKASYYRILSNESEGIPFRVVLHVHELTGLPMWQLCGLPIPPEFKFSIDYLCLNSEHKEIIDRLMKELLEMEGKK